MKVVGKVFVEKLLLRFFLGLEVEFDGFFIHWIFPEFPINSYNFFPLFSITKRNFNFPTLGVLLWDFSI
jgi:hypothetical protein